MAAILARAVTCPFRVLGRCISRTCGRACRCCDDACNCVCTSLASVCADCNSCCICICEAASRVYRRPLGCCMLFTLLMTIAPAGVAFAYAAQGSGCGAPGLSTWLAVQGIVTLLHLALISRLYCKWDMPYDASNPRNRDFFARMSHMLCYDPTVAVHIILCAFSVAWNVVGHTWRTAAVNSTCPAAVLDVTFAALILSWVFLGVGAAAVFLAMLLEWCVTRCCPSLFGCVCRLLCGPDCMRDDSAPSGGDKYAADPPPVGVPVTGYSVAGYPVPQPEYLSAVPVQPAGHMPVVGRGGPTRMPMSATTAMYTGTYAVGGVPALAPQPGPMMLGAAPVVGGAAPVLVPPHQRHSTVPAAAAMGHALGSAVGAAVGAAFGGPRPQQQPQPAAAVAYVHR